MDRLPCCRQYITGFMAMIFVPLIMALLAPDARSNGAIQGVPELAPPVANFTYELTILPEKKIIL